MSTYEIITMICPIISVIVAIITVGITIIIAKRQKSNQIALEQQRKQDLEIQHIHELEVQAKNFLIENHDEIDYLQLCQFAAWNHPYDQHVRKIFNNYNKCSTELQKTILKMNNTVDLKLENFNFDSTYDNLLEQFVNELHSNNLTNLAGDSFLYDGGKYFYRGFEHGRYKICTPKTWDDRDLFNLQFYNIDNDYYSRHEYYPMCWRIEDYLEIKEKKMTEQKFKQRLEAQRMLNTQADNLYAYIIPQNYEDFIKLHQSSPVDHYFNLVSSAYEHECVYIVMRLINACIWNFNNKPKYNFTIDSPELETNEDLYYHTLCNLFHEYSTTISE